MRNKKIMAIIGAIMLCVMSFSALSYAETLPPEIGSEPTAEAVAEPVEDAEAQPTEEAAPVEESAVKESPAEEPTADEPVPAEPVDEPPVTIKEPETEDIAFNADKSDYLAYDPLYIMKYADKRYVNVDEIDMSAFYDIPTAAKGIATYNVRKQSDFDVTEKNFIAGLTYEMPVYDVDSDSDYYVCIPNVNLFNDNFKAYDLVVGYNNDYAELITGWKYSKGILYIPKNAVDKPKNEKDVPEGALLAVQLNYAIGGDMDFSKSIPVQVLSDEEPAEKTVYASNIFDVDNLTVKTGIKGRKASDITVYLNGNLIPISEDAWQYDKQTGEIGIKIAPGVVSNINVVFQLRTTKEKVSDFSTSMLEAITSPAYAATSMDEMSYLCDSAGTPIQLDIYAGDMFVGWRGYYNGKYTHSSKESWYNKVKDYPGWKNSVSYLYGGYVKGNTQSAGAADATWAISSYALAYDLSPGDGAGELTKDKKVTHDGTKKTIYEWLLKYGNSLEKSNLVYGGGKQWKTDENKNGIGGYNNFAFTLPKKITGSNTSLVSSGADAGKANKSISIVSEQILAEQGPNSTSVYYDYWIAAGCNHLDMAEDDNVEGNNNDIYVTCLGLGHDYCVLAFVQSNGGSSTQNACGIYKFKFAPSGYVKVKKVSGNTGITG